VERPLLLLGSLQAQVSNPNSKMLAKSNGYEELIEPIVLHPELKTGKGLQNLLDEYHLPFCNQ
jgi:hypothetical protein